MFDGLCLLIAGILMHRAVKEYSTAALIVFIEFALHGIIYQGGFVETRWLNGGPLHLAYMFIQIFALILMWRTQTHIIITLLIGFNLTLNYLIVLQFLEVHYWPVHQNFIPTARSIMVLELLYLLGITDYVENYHRKYGYVNFIDIDHMLCVWRRTSYRQNDRGVL